MTAGSCMPLSSPAPKVSPWSIPDSSFRRGLCSSALNGERHLRGDHLGELELIALQNYRSAVADHELANDASEQTAGLKVIAPIPSATWPAAETNASGRQFRAYVELITRVVAFDAHRDPTHLPGRFPAPLAASPAILFRSLRLGLHKSRALA